MNGKIEFLVDSVLQSGRFFGRNHFDKITPAGTISDFCLEFVDQSRILGKNCDTEIPLGTTFTTIRKKRVDGDRMHLQSVDLGVCASITLTLKVVEIYRQNIELVPKGTSAGLIVEGDGLRALVEALLNAADREFIFLGA